MITHVVAMTFQDKGNREEAKRRLEELPAQIENDPLDGASGSTSWATRWVADLVLITTHDDVADLKDYQGHPVHQSSAAGCRPCCLARGRRLRELSTARPPVRLSAAFGTMGREPGRRRRRMAELKTTANDGDVEAFLGEHHRRGAAGRRARRLRAHGAAPPASSR